MNLWNIEKAEVPIAGTGVKTVHIGLCSSVKRRSANPLLENFATNARLKMNKIVSKIYRIDPIHFGGGDKKAFIEKMIKDQNGKLKNYFERIQCAQGLAENFELDLYVCFPSANNKPLWYGMLNEIADQNSQLKRLESKYPSYVLFFYDTEEVFAVCGGVGGVRVIDDKIDTQFGFKVVECLIDPDKSDLRTVSKMGLFGIELMSSRSFRANYVFSDEDNFGGFYKGVDVFIDEKKLREIGVTTPKSKLLVRGEVGFKIDNKISFKEIVHRIESIRTLLKKGAEVELNPFRKLRSKDLKAEIDGKPLREYLNEELEKYFFKELDNHTEIYHPNLKEFLNSSRIKFSYPKLDSTEIENWDRFSIMSIFRKLGLDGNLNSFQRFSAILRKISTSIINPETGNKEFQRPLNDWLNGEVVWRDKKYMKLEDNWCTYSAYHEKQINGRISAMFSKVEIEKVLPWNTDFHQEACYNAALGKRSNSLNGDGVFHNGIELADVLEFRTDQLVVYHFKNGFDRNVRVLADQLINSAKVLTEFAAGGQDAHLRNYFDRVLAKNPENKLPMVNDSNFLDLIYSRKIKLVFGIITKKQTTTPEALEEEFCTSRSTIARMALLNACYSVKKWECSFSVAKVYRF